MCSQALKRRVAVIGAGPAGAITTDALVKEQVFNKIRVFDRRPVAGGTWVYTRGEEHNDHSIPSVQNLLAGQAEKASEIPHTFPCETSISKDVEATRVHYTGSAAYENLHSNLPPDVMAFTQEPIPPHVSEYTREQYGNKSPFRHRECIRQWVEDIFKRGGHEHLVEYNTTVELAEKKDDEWILTLRKSDKARGVNVWWQETFDALVVASGHYHLPSLPDIPGLAAYASQFAGRIQHTKHYLNAEAYRDKRVIVVGGSISAFDAVHDMRQTAKSPVISAIRGVSPLFGLTPFQHPDVEIRSQIQSFDAETGRISFMDGSYVDDVDVVMFATGYDFSFPFLPSIKSRNKRIPGLYQHVFLAEDPSLAFIGMVTGGFGLRIFEWQAVATARYLAGRASLPSKKEMREWEQRRTEEKGDGAPFWFLIPDFDVHFEALRDIAREPVPGTTGRVLPPYDPAWGKQFFDLIEFRKKWWKREAGIKD